MFSKGSREKGSRAASNYWSADLRVRILRQLVGTEDFGDYGEARDKGLDREPVVRRFFGLTNIPTTRNCGPYQSFDG